MGIQSELNKVVIAGATAGATIRKAKEEKADLLAKQEKEALAKTKAEEQAKALRNKQEIKADKEREKQKTEEYLKTPEGRLYTAYNRLKEKELNRQAEEQAKRILRAEGHLTQRQTSKAKAMAIKKNIGGQK